LGYSVFNTQYCIWVILDPTPNLERKSGEASVATDV